MAEWVKGNRYLSKSEMQNNAKIIYSYLSSKGWSLNAIAGMLGNMQSESTINPAIWQSLIEGSLGGGGFGLVQWTPWTNFTNWADDNGYEWTDGTAQLKWIDEVTVSFGQWIATSTYNLSFAEFKKSTQSVEWLASAFLKNFERAGVEVEAERRSHAVEWYDYLISYAFTPRLTSDGIEGNKWYYANNPLYQIGYGLPNCTAYCWGRWGELLNDSHSLPTSDAYKWLSDNTVYEEGQTPKLGAVAVFRYGEREYGHVAIVEQINSDGSIVTSNSAYSGTYFYTQTLTKESGYTWDSSVNFLGFIYFPKDFISEIPLPPSQSVKHYVKKKKSSFKFVLYSNRRRQLWNCRN